jgi:hypothetical protein
VDSGGGRESQSQPQSQPQSPAIIEQGPTEPDTTKAPLASIMGECAPMVQNEKVAFFDGRVQVRLPVGVEPEELGEDGRVSGGRAVGGIPRRNAVRLPRECLAGAGQDLRRIGPAVAVGAASSGSRSPFAGAAIRSRYGHTRTPSSPRLRSFTPPPSPAPVSTSSDEVDRAELVETTDGSIMFVAYDAGDNVAAEVAVSTDGIQVSIDGVFVDATLEPRPTAHRPARPRACDVRLASPARRPLA